MLLMQNIHNLEPVFKTFSFAILCAYGYQSENKNDIPLFANSGIPLLFH
jgi:hypothetical protein